MRLNSLLTLLILLSCFLSACGGSSSGNSTVALLEPTQRIELLYVLEGLSGELRKDGEIHQLTIQGVDAELIYFSDRPDRIAGEVAISDWLRDFPFGPVAPNAAVVIENGAPEQNVIIVSLSKPRYDASTASIQFQVEIIPASRSGDLLDFNYDADEILPEYFGKVVIFIDDESVERCAMAVAYDTAIQTPTGHIPVQYLPLQTQVIGTQDGKEFETRVVNFSSGVSPGPPNSLYRIVANNQNLIATGNSCLLRGDGRVERIQDLQAGDMLQLADGAQVPIQFIESGKFSVGIHGLATSTSPAVGHSYMLAANGFVMPEYQWIGEVID